MSVGEYFYCRSWQGLLFLVVVAVLSSGFFGVFLLFVFSFVLFSDRVVREGFNKGVSFLLKHEPVTHEASPRRNGPAETIHMQTPHVHVLPASIHAAINTEASPSL